MDKLYFFLKKCLHEEGFEKPQVNLEVNLYSASKAKLKLVCQFITDNYDKEIKLETVADRACLSPEAFCRLFKKETGMTFLDFLR